MSGAMWPWPLALMLITATFAGLLAWHQATRIDRQVQRERWRRQPQSLRELGFVLGALVTAVAAATVLQLSLVPRIGH
jgi:hypothetical protein